MLSVDLGFNIGLESPLSAPVSHCCVILQSALFLGSLITRMAGTGNVKKYPPNFGPAILSFFFSLLRSLGPKRNTCISDHSNFLIFLINLLLTGWHSCSAQFSCCNIICNDAPCWPFLSWFHIECVKHLLQPSITLSLMLGHLC